DEVPDFIEAHSDAQVSSPDEAAEVMARYVTRLGNAEGADPATWSREQQVSYAAMRALKQRINEEGWDHQNIQKQAIERVRRRFPDPNDAEMMLHRFLRAEPESGTFTPYKDE